MSLNRSFVFLRYPETHLDDPSNPDDYLRNPNAATKVVQSLKKMGIKCFLVLPGRWPTLDDYRIIGRAIEAAGLQFFSYEGWSWEDAIDDGGHFDSAKYLQNWV